MFNDKLGERRQIDGTSHLMVHRGRQGHAVYGPYERYEPGRYTVEFSLLPVEGENYGGEGICAFVDVAADFGRRLIAHDVVWTTSLRGGASNPKLSFSIDESLELEFRVYWIGTVAALVADRVVVHDGHQMKVPCVEEPFVEIGGIRIASSSYDDVCFIDEILYKRAYNLISTADICFIDVGMNVGLASLLFARMANVREVHAFEPFPDTYARARRNLQLNPEIASKVVAYPFGLAARDEELIVQVEEGEVSSGGRNLWFDSGSRSIRLDVRDASSILGPLIGRATAQGRQVIAKIDCEGSEFDIFASLAKAGLIGSVSAFMVEWHRVFEGRDQSELIAPLTNAGFIVIDISPDEGNGFFYAVRPAPPTRRRGWGMWPFQARAS